MWLRERRLAQNRGYLAVGRGNSLTSRCGRGGEELNYCCSGGGGGGGGSLVALGGRRLGSLVVTVGGSGSIAFGGMRLGNSLVAVERSGSGYGGGDRERVGVFDVSLELSLVEGCCKSG